MWFVRCIQASFHIPENRLNFPTTKGFRTKISKKLVCQYMTIFFNFYTHIKSSLSTTSRELRQQFRLERVKLSDFWICCYRVLSKRKLYYTCIPAKHNYNKADNIYQNWLNIGTPFATLAKRIGIVFSELCDYSRRDDYVTWTHFLKYKD